MAIRKQHVFHTDSFTKGGQVFSHEWRMRLQNLRIVIVLGIICGALGLWASSWYYGLSFWQVWDFYTVSYLGGKVKIALWPWIKSCLLELDKLLKLLPGGKGVYSAYKEVSQLTTELFAPERGKIYMRTVEFLEHPWILDQASRVHTVLLFGLGSWALSIAGMIYGFRRKSQKIEKDKILQGKVIELPKIVRKILKKRKIASDLYIAPQLPLVKDSETEHMMIIGSVGSGKTNCIHGLLPQLRNKGQKAIILDTNCGYVNRYYDSRKGDLILNPFDSRSVCWNLWEDCKKTSEYDQFATALIPEPKSNSNPVWHKNAREIIATTAEKLALQGDKSLMSLVEYASWKSLSKVKTFFKNTPVESLMHAQGRAEEVVHSVRMQMTDSMKRLAMLPQEGTPFSISKWVIEEKRPAWLFISCTENDRSTLGTLMKFWLNLAIQSLLKRGEDLNHRLWFIMDELFSLEGGMVDDLYTLLREGRKYGGCAVLGFQNLAGLEKTYGPTGMKEAVSLCNTKVILRTPEPNTAGYLAQSLGEQEVIQSSESFSIGSHHMRDGVNMAGHNRIRTTVSKTEIMDLPKFESYISLPGDLPLCRVKFPLNAVPLVYRQENYERPISLLPLLADRGKEKEEQEEEEDFQES